VAEVLPERLVGTGAPIGQMAPISNRAVCFDNGDGKPHIGYGSLALAGMARFFAKKRTQRSGQFVRLRF
jgi:hypothetical protein